MRKNRLIIILTFVLVVGLLAVGCSAKMSMEDMSMEAPKAAAPMEAEESWDSAEDQGVLANKQSAQGSTEGQNLQEKIIYNVNMTLVCEDVNVAMERLTNKVITLGGYVQRSDMSKSGDKVYASLTVRVPSPNLSDMRSFAKEVGTVDHSNMYTNNITESYYDVKGRLKNARFQEEQLLKIMDKAETIEDILRVRAELDGIQERIESYEGQIRMWDSLVDYSTVEFTLRPIETLDTTEDGPRLIGMGETGRALLRNLKNTAIHLANFFSFLIRNLPILIIIAIIVGTILLIVRRSRRKSPPVQSVNNAKDNK